MLASTVMAVRVIGLVVVTNAALVREVAIPVGAMAVAGLIAGAVLFLRSRKEGANAENVEFANPFEISSALKFGVVFTIVLLASKFATTTWGHKGTYIAALLAGGTDVDAITLSLSRFALDPKEAAIGIFLACASNTLVKAGIALAIGGWAFGWRLAATFAGMIAAGAATLLFLR